METTTKNKTANIDDDQWLDADNVNESTSAELEEGDFLPQDSEL